MPTAIQFSRILQCLLARNVDFIVVGNVSAVLQGAPITTMDLDLVHARDEGNVTRLLEALDELDAYYRERKDKKIRPTRSHVTTAGHHLLMTAFGPLDLLGTIGSDEDYAALLPCTTQKRLDANLTVHVLTLEKLIQLKEGAGRPKDLAVLPVLKQVLKESGA